MSTDEHIGRAVLWATVHHRHPEEQFPLTGGWVQRQARRLGRPVGEHRSYKIIRLLKTKGLIVPAGSYRGAYRLGYPSGFRVPLFRLPRATSNRQLKVSVRTRRARKPWWRHPLFGFGVEKYPRSLQRRLQKWKEPPW